MTLLMPVLGFVFVLALMVWLLFDPTSLQNVMQRAIPPEARSAPPRYPHFAVIVIFAAGVGLFHLLGTGAAIHSPHFTGAFQFYSLLFAAFFLGANGVWACYWPISFQRIYIPKLRHVQEVDLPAKTKRIFVICGRSWGVLLLLASAYLVHILGTW